MFHIDLSFITSRICSPIPILAIFSANTFVGPQWRSTTTHPSSKTRHASSKSCRSSRSAARTRPAGRSFALWASTFPVSFNVSLLQELYFYCSWQFWLACSWWVSAQLRLWAGTVWGSTWKRIFIRHCPGCHSASCTSTRRWCEPRTFPGSQSSGRRTRRHRQPSRRASTPSTSSIPAFKPGSSSPPSAACFSAPGTLI